MSENRRRTGSIAPARDKAGREMVRDTFSLGSPRKPERARDGYENPDMQDFP